MPNIYNIYCDESCWMHFDQSQVIAWGAIWCPQESVKEIHEELRTIKRIYDINPYFEIKWNKVSMGEIEFYLELINFIFERDDVFYRCLIVPDKSILNHAEFKQSHDEWYYKMYYDLLKAIVDPAINPNTSFNIFFDYKDTRQSNSLRELQNTLVNSFRNTEKDLIIQSKGVNSEEVGLVQLADLLTGAMTYFNRGLYKNEAKIKIIELIKEKTDLTLRNSTSLQRKKFNILVWRPK